MTDTATTSPLQDKNGFALERGMRVKTKDGFNAHVTRLDAKSGRAVVIFDEVDGAVPVNPTMRRVNTLEVRKVAGKVLRIKEIVKAAKVEKVEAPPKEPKISKAKAPAKPKKAKVEALEPVELLITDGEDEEIEIQDLDALLATLPGEALEV